MPGHIYKNPEIYSKNNELQYNFAMKVLAKAKIYPADRLLDLGCGDGRLTLYMAKLASQGCVIGADISERMVDHANENYKSQHNLRFVQMDASKNVFKKQFDVITSFNSLHWIKDQRSVLNGVALAAAEDARIILLLSHRKSHYHHALDIVCASQQWSRYFKDYSSPRAFFSKENYQELLLSSGIDVVSIEENEMIYEFSFIAELKAFLVASMANIKKIPDGFKEDFIEDFCVEFMKQSKCRSSTCIPVGFWCLEIFATNT